MGLKDSLSKTNLGLGGATPANREGASADTTKIHTPGGVAPQAASHSQFDLDGGTPEKYMDKEHE